MKLQAFVSGFLIFLCSFFLLNVQAEAKSVFVKAGAKKAINAIQSSKQTKKVWTSTSQKTSLQNARGHWLEHKSKFKNITFNQYTKKAKYFIDNPPKGTLKKFRAETQKGKTTFKKIFYNVKSNTFAVSTKKGIPKTFFKPNNPNQGKRYYLKQ